MRNNCEAAALLVLLAVGLPIVAACSSPPVYRARYRVPPLIRSVVEPCEEFGASPHALEMLDVGTEPRRLLRLGPRDGLRMTIPLDSETTLSAESDGFAPDGTACYLFTIKTTVPDAFNALPPDGGLSISPDGRIGVRKSRHPKINRRERAFHEGAMIEQLFRFAPRLPPEEVGLGARWRYVRKYVSFSPYGPPNNHELTYTLVEMAGSHLVLQVHWYRENPRQYIPTPGATPDDPPENQGHWRSPSITDESYRLDVDLETFPLPRRSPVPLSFAEKLRRNGQYVEKQE